MAETVLAEFGTRLAKTRIVKTQDGGCAWLIAKEAADKSALPEEDLLRGLRLCHRGRTELVLPEKEGEWLRFTAPGSIAAFYLVFSEDNGASMALIEAVSGMGGALRELHGHEFSGRLPATPPGITRLARWARNRGDGPGNSSALYDLAVRDLGGRRLATLGNWLDELTESSGERLLHGAPSLGFLVPSPNSDKPHVLLTGAELCTGDPETDLGWICGELVELHRLAGLGMVNPLTVAPEFLCEQLIAGYDAPVDLAKLGRASVLRLLTHAYDFAAYVTWNDSLTAYTRIVADLVDAGGELKEAFSH